MKKYLTLIFFLSVFLSPCKADDAESLVISLGGFEMKEKPGEEGKDPIKHRLPSRHLECIITHEGITIPGYNSEDILAYEIYTEDGVPVANFADEEDFISFIFSAEGTYEIRLQFEEVTLKGYISL